VDVRLSFVLILMCVSFAYADNYYSQDFRGGYEAGYDHGYRDQQVRAGFDFRHDYEYQASSGPHSYSSNSGCEYRWGYVEGYSDGYFNRPSLMNTHGPANPERPDAIVAYSEEDFKGSSRVYAAGEYRYLEDGWDDKIESIRLNGNYRVILYDDKDFKGENTVIDHSTNDLGHFKKKAASMIIEPINSYR
jgi:hypothetical protein